MLYYPKRFVFIISLSSAFRNDNFLTVFFIIISDNIIKFFW
ncbi:Uncharacterized protein dnm_026220 [Desulfonema magnum]|uniref:Uncharacterized protein n=1 Tax=Desulfonema magnum TaxID=45655 RepID=A0A975BJQ4_9BACT|nr:Uncharacterized protein dnm_026220 [Desulfonema magnum]